MGKAKKTIAKCEECGGPRRGPKAHAPTCSHYKSPEERKTGKPGVSDGLGMAEICRAFRRNFDVEQLMKIRTDLDAVLAEQLPELDERIKALQDMKAKIGKPSK